ncbi:acyl-CoA N-acyltransferase [Rhizoclosmatium globosum]|uniref:Acyl-CoA N-acyltransferase n=1 Tax=Rhizoclosmatium globosum TaxID=329046 RepID=A0A1Y2BVH7_9FUNG|nr:acyl-CoA N-acyltransferase [Rhizoclosmatium globosum]|eukprot:ORY38788.1 acyl-CoA N-acyltransferase [Rhizoclosmatium globosum]
MASPKAPIPTQMHTSRLILRAFEDADALPFHEAIEPALPSLRKWISSTTEQNTLQTQQARIRKAQSDWAAGTRYNYLVIERETGCIAGLVGVFNVNWTNRNCTFGYWLVPSCEGKGYAAEAVRQLEAVATGEMGLDRIAIMCDVRNERSARLARKLGYVYEGTLRKEYVGPQGDLTDTLVFSKVRGEEYH